MQMRHRLTGVRPIIEDEAKPGLRQAELARHFSRFKQEMAEHGMILRLGLGNPWNGLFGDDQHMRWGLRLHIPESKDQFILVHNRGRYFARDDFLKKGFAHGEKNLLRQRFFVNQNRSSFELIAVREIS
jgi:hypothetical protein